MKVETIYDYRELQKGDIIIILTAEQYYESGDEITDIIERFAGESLVVISVDHTPNYFDEITVMAEYHDGSIASFTGHEIHTALRVKE